MGKPGVMIYFEVIPALKQLTKEQNGILFEAIMDYAAQGVVPELEPPLSLLWSFLGPAIDRDSERYQTVVKRNEYARYAKKCRKTGELKLSYETWQQKYYPADVQEPDENAFSEEISELYGMDQTEETPRKNNSFSYLDYFRTQLQ